ncbi:MAG TPA: hypothetical protein VJV97_08835 [Gemmatimonadaceae bacterium]|nr:hypothetical protein [Gemmatimonadaceae bacterium]
MVDEGRSGAYGGAKPWEDRSGRAAGTILATAIAAGVIAFLLRRSREEEEPTTRVAKLARDLAGSDSVEAGRDFLMDRVLPELKPALLSALSEIEDVVDEAFRRIEKNIKKL